MKRKFRVFAAVAMVLTAAACSKETAYEATLPGEMTITAGLEASKAYLEGGVIKWKTSDILTVFDSANNGVDFTAGTISDDKKSCNFSTTSWTGKTPTYAVAYNAEWDETRATSCTSAGVLPVRVRKTQNNHSWKGCSSPFANASVGTVKKNEENQTYSIDQMKNVVGYIGINLSKSTTKKITVESLGDEPLAGWVDVDYAKLINGDTDFWTLRQGESGDNTITLTTTASGGSVVGGCFGAGTYYVGVLPQTYADGIKFTLYDADDKVIAERTIGANSGITIKRSELTPVGGNADVTPVVLPDVVVIDLYFGSGTNPLGFSNPGLTNESASGDTYDYTYSYEDPVTKEPKTTTFPIVVCRGTPEEGAFGYRYFSTTNTSYGNKTPVVMFHKCTNGWIKAPAIEGYYLQTISLSHGNTADTQHMRIKDNPSNSSIAQMTLTKGGADGPATMTVHFYTDGNDCNNASMNSNTTSISTAYYMIFAEKNQVIDRLTFTYTKTLPTK